MSDMDGLEDGSSECVDVCSLSGNVWTEKEGIKYSSCEVLRVASLSINYFRLSVSLKSYFLNQQSLCQL